MLPLFQIHEIFIYCHPLLLVIFILSSTFEDAVTIFSPIVLVCEKIGEKNKIKHVCKHNLVESFNANIVFNSSTMHTVTNKKSLRGWSYVSGAGDGA
jgi:hypothetical protein